MTSLRVGRKASREQTREQNRRLVLQEIFAADAISRADIARSSGLTRATVSDLVTELADEGLLRTAGTGPSTGGKPPVLIEIATDARHLVTVDVSGPQLLGTITDLRGDPIDSITPRPVGRGQAAVDAIAVAVDELRQRSAAPLLGIGIGTPGVVHPSGFIAEAANLGWHELDLGSELGSRLGAPVHILNDSQAAALAEFSDRAAARNLIVVTAGPGIGAGIILDGRLFRGDGYGAGEIGHISIADAPRCRCGNDGCLEAIAGSDAVLEAIRPSVPTLPADPEATWPALAALVEQGHEATMNAFADAGRAIGVSLAHLVGILDVHEIVIVGELARGGAHFVGTLGQELTRRVLPALAASVTVSLGAHDPHRVRRGAATMVLNRELGVA